MLVKAFNAIPIPRASLSVRVNAFSAVLISCAAIARANDLARQGWDESSTGFKSIFSSGVVSEPLAQHHLGQGTTCSASPGTGTTFQASLGQG